MPTIVSEKIVAEIERPKAARNAIRKVLTVVAADGESVTLGPPLAREILDVSAYLATDGRYIVSCYPTVSGGTVTLKIYALDATAGTAVKPAGSITIVLTVDYVPIY